MLVLGHFEAAAEIRELALRGEVALDLVTQRFDEPGNGNENRNALAAYRLNNFGGIQCIEEHRCAAKKLGDKNAEQLPEDVAERQKVHDAQRMDPSFVAAVTSD